jgi:hypothetical protein
MLSWPHRGMVICGLIVVFAGFLWNVFFAGVPYQDPTPELSANYDFHSNAAFGLMCAGAGLALIGLAGLLAKWLFSSRPKGPGL